MSKVKYASIVPLIGGQTMGMEKVWGEKPEFFLSFPGFQDHDQHARAYYPNTPYHIVEDNTPLDAKFTGVDVLSTTCPCAGLSSLSPSANSESATNDWMLRSADVALGQVKPRVFWGENAPRLATKMGEVTHSHCTRQSQSFMAFLKSVIGLSTSFGKEQSRLF